MAGWSSFVARLLTAGSLLLAGAAAQAGSRHAPPPPPPAPKGPVDYLKSLLPMTTVDQPQDFVRDSRPATEGDFMPVGLSPPDPELKAKTDTELAATKAELEAAQNANKQLIANPPKLSVSLAPPPPPPPAAAAAPAATPPAKKIAKHARKRPASVAAASAN